MNAAYLPGPGATGERLAPLAAIWSGMRRRDRFSLQPRRELVDALLRAALL